MLTITPISDTMFGVIGVLKMYGNNGLRIRLLRRA